MNASPREPDRWRALAREVGGKIGRSPEPVALLLGAGASLSSGAPATSAVVAAFVEAAGARLSGIDIMQGIALIDEREKQQILAPLFRSVTPGAGYHALVSLAAYRKVVVLNLNWDHAISDAAEARGVLRASFDVKDHPTTWPSFGGASEPGLYDIHLHGMLGTSCRFGSLETLSFSDPELELLRTQGLDGLLVCLGASLDGEQDLPSLFRLHQTQRDATRANDHWYFLRGDEEQDGTDRFRAEITYAPP